MPGILKSFTKITSRWIIFFLEQMLAFSAFLSSLLIISSVTHRDITDMRSFFLDYEVSLMSVDADFVSQLKVVSQQYRDRSTELTPELAAIVRASREAMVNAAKHSGAERVDVFAEADEDQVSVYIREE